MLHCVFCTRIILCTRYCAFCACCFDDTLLYVLCVFYFVYFGLYFVRVVLFKHFTVYFVHVVLCFTLLHVFCACCTVSVLLRILCMLFFCVTLYCCVLCQPWYNPFWLSRMKTPANKLSNFITDRAFCACCFVYNTTATVYFVHVVLCITPRLLCILCMSLCV